MYEQYWGMYVFPMEDHVMLIDNEPSKAIHNNKYNDMFFESFKGRMS